MDRGKHPNKEYRDPRTWMVDGIPIPQLPMSEDEMARENIPRAYRDACAHILVPLNKCRDKHGHSLWSCKRLRHDYYLCQHKEVIRKMAIRNEMQKQGKLPPKRWENPSPEYVNEMRANGVKGYEGYGAYVPDASKGADVPHARPGQVPSAPTNRPAPWKVLFFWGDYDGNHSPVKVE
ncbi:unnamed protein product [Pedinophyceae sp. YPF-701]|nr:unnamed protein product [Pedinophyceae sp. YPF-701]